MQLLETGRLAADYWDWEAGVAFDWHRTGKNKGEGGEDDKSEDDSDDAEPCAAAGQLAPAPAFPEPAACGVELTLDWPRPLRPAGDLQAPFSNYVFSYQGLLDYVWCALRSAFGGWGVGGDGCSV